MHRHPDCPANEREMAKFCRERRLPTRRSGKNHVVVDLGNGSELTYSDHGEWGPATRCAIRRALAAAGLVGILILALLAQGML